MKEKTGMSAIRSLKGAMDCYAEAEADYTEACEAEEEDGSLDTDSYESWEDTRLDLLDGTIMTGLTELLGDDETPGQLAQLADLAETRANALETAFGAETPVRAISGAIDDLRAIAAALRGADA